MNDIQSQESLKSYFKIGHRRLPFLFFLLLTFSFFPKAYAQEYFQQEVNYKIQVTLNDKRHELDAFEAVDYINNSPDTLRYLFFHLWPNAYSDNSTCLAKQLFELNGKDKLFRDPELKGYIDSLDFKIDGRRAKWNLVVGMPDICRIFPEAPVAPGDTITISTPFHVKIPEGITSRLGHIGESYQISQWYPKPAVYDISGWHQMPYLDQGEYYSEFGCFDVSITLPGNYLVGATGNLGNSMEPAMFDNLAADTVWKNTAYYGESAFPVSSSEMKTVRFTGNQIHDFAWFADKRFHVLKGKVKLPDSGREITTCVMFTDRQSELWENALKYVNSAILYFSNLIGDYPYDTFTAVQSALSAGVGMEYPGITVIGLTDDAYALEEVIAHETCHSWFYSALGSDERRYPYMDESITSAYTERYMNEKYPVKKLWEVYVRNREMKKFFHVDQMPVQRMNEIEWLMQARSNLEQPLNLPATAYSNLDYSLIIYDKGATGFNYLRSYLGNSVFDSAMHDYYRSWKNRHPRPGDLHLIFEKHTEKDLSWFFGDFLGTIKRLDYKAARLRGRQLLLKNKGELVSPLVISGMNGDSVIVEIWSDGFRGKRWIDIPPGKYSEIKIDPDHIMPELNRLNNNIRTHGIFRKADPVRTQLLFTLIEDPDTRSLIYIPTANWNRENGFMVGMALHNGLLLPKPVEYFIMPFYSFKDPALAGYGRVSFNIMPFNNFIRMATITLEGSQFRAPGSQNFQKAVSSLNIFFRTKKMNDPVKQKVYANYIVASDLFKIERLEKAGISSYVQFGYVLDKTTVINPLNLSASLETNKSFQKLSLEFKYRYSYYGKTNGMDIRFFAGTMLRNSLETPLYSLSASGRSGRELYLYEGTYPDRFSLFPETFWSRQMTLAEGSLTSPVNDSLGFSSWLISLSFTSNLPGRAGLLPVKPFVNLLLNDHGNGTAHRSPFFFEAGVKAGIWDFFEIYIPLVVSPNIISMTGPFKDRIRIVIRLDPFYRSNLKTRTVN